MIITFGFIKQTVFSSNLICCLKSINISTRQFDIKVVSPATTTSEQAMLLTLPIFHSFCFILDYNSPSYFRWHLSYVLLYELLFYYSGWDSFVDVCCASRNNRNYLYFIGEFAHKLVVLGLTVL